MMPSKPTSSARAYCSWYSLYSTCAFMGSKWVLGKPRRPESYLLRSSSVTYPLGCSENQKTSTLSVGRRSCSTIRASCFLCIVMGIPRSTFAVPEYVPILVRCQSMTHHDPASLARPRLNLSKELEDALDILRRSFSVRRDLPPLAVGNKPVHQLCHPPRVYIVVSRHDQGRYPDTLEHLYRRPQGRIGAIEEGINRVPHDLGILLWWHGLEVFSKPRIVLDALRDKWRKAVIPVKGGHHCLHTLGEGQVEAPVELRRQVRVTDNATGKVGREDGPDPIRVSRGAPHGDGGTEGATTQESLVYAQGVHEPHDVLTYLVPGLHHHGALRLAAEASVIGNDPVRVGQARQHRLVAFQHALQATGGQDHGRPAASLFIVNLRTVHLRSSHGSPFSYDCAAHKLLEHMEDRKCQYPFQARRPACTGSARGLGTHPASELDNRRWLLYNRYHTSGSLLHRRCAHSQS